MSEASPKIEDKILERNQSYLNHYCHIQNIPNPSQIQYMNFTHSIGWSFPKQKKLMPDKDDPLFTPSPTKYEIKDISIKTPAWLIPHSKRLLNVVTSKTPGSGNYEYKTFIGEGPKYIINPKTVLDKTSTKKLEKCLSAINIPGPGFYDPIDKTSGPKITIGEKHYKNKNKKNEKLLPGVGTYNLRKDSQFIIPSFKFDKEQRIDMSLNRTTFNFPGPNKYNNLEGNPSKTPKWTFSKVERFPRSKSTKNIFPGPGNYSYKEYIGNENPKYTFNKDKFNHADAIEESIKNKTKNYPSPTTYLKNIKYISDTPKYSITKSKRSENINIKNISPNPQTYNPNKENASYFKKLPVWTISKSNRDENEKVKDSKKIHYITPGPGEYNIKNGNIPQGPSYTIITRKKNKEIDILPGPGQYKLNYNNIKENNPKYSIGKEKRDNELKQIIKDNYPGPGSYKIKDNKAYKDITFPHSKKNIENKFNVPGPGKYKIPTAFDYINNITREQGIFDPTFKYV